jgi:hypothetical protein
MTLRKIAFAAVTSAVLGLLGVSAATAIPASGVAISEAAAAIQPAAGLVAPLPLAPLALASLAPLVTQLKIRGRWQLGAQHLLYSG